MKLYYLMIVSILFSSCSTIEITDEDGDGVSDGNRFITKVYDAREKLDFHYFLRTLISDSSDSYSETYWFAGGSPLEAEPGFFQNQKRIKKGDAIYQWEESSDNKNSSVYEVLDASGVGTGTFVVMAIEALPIFDENPAVLLISAGIPFTTIDEARAYGVANEIPKLTITIPFLDLVFDPDTLVIEDDNMAEHLASIVGDPNATPPVLAKYTVLEIFGSKSYTDKKNLLKSFAYDVLLPDPLP